MKKLALALTLACLVGPASVRAQNAYITNQGSNTVSVIDTATDAVIATILVGARAFGVAVSPDGSTVYVTKSFALPPGPISVIDTATNTVIATTGDPIAGGTFGVAVTPDGSKVYVTNGESNTIEVIDTIRVGFSPIGVAVNTDGSKVYVANNEDKTVSVIDTATNFVIATIPVGIGPVAFGVFIQPTQPDPKGEENTAGRSLRVLQREGTARCHS